MTDTLRVLYVLGHGGMGGIERHVQTQIRALKGQPIAPFLCVLAHPGIVSDAIAGDGCPVVTLGARSGHTPSLLPRFFRLVRRVRPDVVHLHGPHLVPGLVMRLFPHIAVVCSQHCPSVDDPEIWKAKLLWRLVRGSLDIITPVSRWTGEELTRYHGIPQSQMQVVYNSVNVRNLAERASRARAEGYDTGRKVVGGIGRLVEGKGWEDFLETAALLQRMRRDVGFMVVGDGPLRDPLKRRAEELGVADCVEWLGFRDDAVECLARFDLFLFTSHHEELPTTLLEAFAVGTPVAGFLPAGGTAEILALSEGSAARLFTERSCLNLARTASNLLDSPHTVQALTETASRLVHEHFDVERSAAEMARLYRHLVCGATTSREKVAVRATRVAGSNGLAQRDSRRWRGE